MQKNSFSSPFFVVLVVVVGRVVLLLCQWTEQKSSSNLISIRHASVSNPSTPPRKGALFVTFEGALPIATTAAFMTCAR